MVQMMGLPVHLAAFVAIASLCVEAKSKPDITFILADDLGMYDTAVHNPNSPTPNIRDVAMEGIVLENHYVFRYCSPTRRSFLSGRFPNHITTVQPDGSNLCPDFLPLAIKTIAEKLEPVGYQSHFVGKGHLGYETMDHLPVNRGFLTHVGYLGGAEGYYHGGGDPDPTKGNHDMWDGLAPGLEAVKEMYYSANYYTEKATGFINAHDSSKGPLFLYFPIQNVHSPYDKPPAWEYNNYPKMWDDTYANMLHMMDSAVGNVTSALKEKGLWDNSILLYSADNGGVGKFGNNYPLRGHKHDPWEGGTRVVAFVSGGLIPASLRGTKSGAKLVHIADWYATFCVMAGVDPSNPVEFNGTVRDIDGVDVWPMLMGTNVTHPRPITPTSEAGIIEIQNATSWLKVVNLAGNSNYYTKNDTQIKGTDPCLAGTQRDPFEPGRTDPIVNGCPVCNATMPCVYDVVSDPGETNNIAASHPDVIARLIPLLEKFNKYYVTGHLSQEVLDKEYTKINASRWGHFLGPCYERK